jgi:hypothetical protein
LVLKESYIRNLNLRTDAFRKGREIVLEMYSDFAEAVTVIDLKQPTFIRYIVLQLVCGYNLWYV